MRLRVLACMTVWLAACASFEPRISVESHKPAGNMSAPESAPTDGAVATSVAGGYVVARGDTLYGIAFRNKLDFRDLAAWNNIAAPYTIYPGQPLRLTPPTRTTRVVVPDPPVAATAVAAAPVDAALPVAAAVVDTSDVQTFAVSDDPAPGAVAAAQPLITQAAPAATPATSSPAAAIGLAPTAPAPAEVAAVPVAAATADVGVAVAPTPAAVDSAPRAVVDPKAPTREREGLRWRWPVNGALIGRFVEGDPTQQGIDLGGGLGNPVLAAAAGEVVYSGNGLLGYGELVIVQHTPGFLSAYGHNQKLLVLEGAKVQAGQPIAEMGRRGGIDMLHFEIRRNGKPVDPLGYLPQR
ncbi:MAG: peptidoglycan DD-metalloendopeptidase family protein [Xanthomonadales bacterium]|nr:peptidoglycan DD-metalloendopeptidase family protein [Xanthomonadales bacterium]